MNQLGMGGAPVTGSLLTPDPAEETAALERAKREDAAREAELVSGHEGDREREARVEEREALAGRPEAGRPKDIAD